MNKEGLNIQLMKRVYHSFKAILTGKRVLEVLVESYEPELFHLKISSAACVYLFCTKCFIFFFFLTNFYYAGVLRKTIGFVTICLLSTLVRICKK